MTNAIDAKELSEAIRLARGARAKAGIIHDALQDANAVDGMSDVLIRTELKRTLEYIRACNDHNEMIDRFGRWMDSKIGHEFISRKWQPAIYALGSNLSPWCGITRDYGPEDSPEQLLEEIQLLALAMGQNLDITTRGDTLHAHCQVVGIGRISLSIYRVPREVIDLAIMIGTTGQLG